MTEWKIDNGWMKTLWVLNCAYTVLGIIGTLMILAGY